MEAGMGRSILLTFDAQNFGAYFLEDRILRFIHQFKKLRVDFRVEDWEIIWYHTVKNIIIITQMLNVYYFHK